MVHLCVQDTWFRTICSFQAEQRSTFTVTSSETIAHNLTIHGGPYLLPPASFGCGKVIFSLCMSVHTSTGGIPHPPSQVWMGGGYPIPGLDRGYPITGLDGYPWGTPWPGLDGVPPIPARTVWGTPLARTGWGKPPGQDWIGYPLPPIRQSSILSKTFYAAGGMSLTFTQEDFLVVQWGHVVVYRDEGGIVPKVKSQQLPK